MIETNQGTFDLRISHRNTLAATYGGKMLSRGCAALAKLIAQLRRCGQCFIRGVGRY
jgi:hypothetical protein